MKAVVNGAWIYAGKHFGPGEVEFAESEAHIVAALKERGAIALDAKPQQGEEGGKGQEAPVAKSLAELLGGPQAKTLADAGYTTADQLAVVDDATLLVIAGIGEGTVRKIREFAPHQAE